jgi:hypothetical protein
MIFKIKIREKAADLGNGDESHLADQHFSGAQVGRLPNLTGQIKKPNL